MPIATASLDLDAYGRARKLSPPITPELTALSGCQLFAGAAPSTLRSLGQACAIKPYPRGSIVAAEGSLVTQAFLVLRGRVRAVRRGENGREMTMEIFRVGDLIADAILAPDQPITNDWEAVEPTSLLVLPREALVGHLSLLPDLPLALGRQLLGRLNRSKDLAVGLALSDVQARVVATLRLLASQDGEETPDGVLLHHRPTQQELANLIGACRETVSRIVSDLTRQGLLTPQGRSLLISKRLNS